MPGPPGFVIVAGMTNRHPRARRGARAATVGLVLASALGAAAGGPAPAAGAAEEPPPERPSERPPERVRTARLCDNTVCYVAWRVVDSDHDGVSDADELAAGTDPWDPTSWPRPEVVVELAGAGKLPSFEYGVGAFVVFPIDLAKLNTEQMPDLGGGAFPIEGRKDALATAGISTDLLAEMGIDIGRDGFTIGLEHPTKEGELPARRIAGFDVRTISAGGSDGGIMPGVQGGGVIGTSRNADGSSTMWLSDGGKVVTSNENGVTTVDRYGPNGELQGSSSSVSDRTSDQVPGSTTTTVHSDGKGNVTGTTISSSYTLPNGLTVNTTEKRTYLRDANGNITGQRVVTTTSVGNGRSGSTSGYVEICDAQGKDCGPPVEHGSDDDDHGDGAGDHGDDGDHGGDADHGGDSDDHDDGDGGHDDDPEGDHGYENPDADLTVISVDDVDGVLRMRGAAITTVQNWTAPGSTDELPEHDRWGGVAYVDDTGQTFTVLSEPRITGAQPEYDPNMPSPFDGAPNPLDGSDNCGGLCRTG